MVSQYLVDLIWLGANKQYYKLIIIKLFFKVWPDENYSMKKSDDINITYWSFVTRSKNHDCHLQVALEKGENSTILTGITTTGYIIQQSQHNNKTINGEK